MRLPGVALPLLLSAALSSAPFQCASHADPAKRMEDDPAQALYDLSVEFHQKGDEKARVETLRFIVARYPASRFAERARIELQGS